MTSAIAPTVASHHCDASCSWKPGCGLSMDSGRRAPATDRPEPSNTIALTAVVEQSTASTSESAIRRHDYLEAITRDGERERVLHLPKREHVRDNARHVDPAVTHHRDRARVDILHPPHHHQRQPLA